MKNLLVCIDFSDETKIILKHAKALAQSMSAKVWLLHVASPTPDFVSFEIGPQIVRDQQAHILKSEHRELHEMQKKFAKSGLETTAIMVEGLTVDKILEQAKDIKADIILLGTHGSGQIHQLLVGSVSQGVIKKTPCPVLLIPTKYID